MPNEDTKEISKIKEFLKQVDKNTITGPSKIDRLPVVFFHIGVKMADYF